MSRVSAAAEVPALPRVAARDSPAEHQAERGAAAAMQGVAPQMGGSVSTTRFAPINRQAVAAAARATKQGGMPLRAADKALYEPRFGQSLDQIRIHADPTAGHAAQEIGARAFTRGNHIAFAPGQYAPHTQSGQRLIAHELTHSLHHADGTIYRDADPALAPAPPAPEATPEIEDGVERGETEEMDFAFVFTGGSFGRNATAFIERYHPDHELIRSTSFEAMFNTLHTRMMASRRRGMDPHLRELIIVTHANAAGGLQIPLTRGTGRNPDGFFNIWSLADLQQDLRDGLHRRFRARRRAVVADLMDDSTRVIVRGCEFGQAPEAMAALRSFFGGDAWIWAPTGFQGYETLRIGGERLPTPEAAFDFLIEQEYLPPELEPLDDESKREYIARVFGVNGTIPATFFVMGEEHYSALRALDRQGRGTSNAAEEHKDRDENLLESSGEHWSVSHPSFLGRPDAELDALSLDELEARGRALMRDYRPEIAYMVVRLRNAWERKGLEVLERCEDSSDPLCGLPPVDAFGSSNIVGTDASRFPGPNIDAFETTTIELPEEETDAGDFEDAPAFGTPEAPPAPDNLGRPRPARPEAAQNTPQSGSGSTSRRSAARRQSGRAAAMDFDKSRGRIPPRPAPEPEPPDVEAIIAAITDPDAREAAREILDRLPPEGWTTSSYLSAAELSINVATAPITFMEAAAATFAIEAGGIVLGGLLSIVGFFVALDESREAHALASQALGVQLGYERLGWQLWGDRINGDVDPEKMREGLRDDYRVISQIRYNIPHAGRTALPNIIEGVDAVTLDANRVLEAADRTLRTRLTDAGLRGDDFNRAFEAARPIVRRRFINQMMRQGFEAIARRRRLLEARR